MKNVGDDRCDITPTGGSHESLVFAGGSHGELACVRDCSDVAVEGGWATSDARFVNDALFGLSSDRGDAFRRASSLWPKEPLGQPDSPLSLFFCFKNELIDSKILLRLSFGLLREVPNAKW